MPAPQKRSPEPLEGIKRHGAAGYAKGCGCDVCRNGQTDKLKRYRDRKAAGTVGTNVIRFPQTAGKFERGVLEMVHEIQAEGPEAQLLVDMMIFNAQLLDQIPTNGRWHLAQGAQKSIRELKEELHKLAGGGPKPAGEESGGLEGFLNGLTKQSK